MKKRASSDARFPVVYEVGFKSTFLCIRRLFQDGRPADPVPVLDAMQSKENYAKFLRDCMDVTPTAANVLEYCKILRRLTWVSRIAVLAASLSLLP